MWFLVSFTYSAFKRIKWPKTSSCSCVRKLVDYNRSFQKQCTSFRKQGWKPAMHLFNNWSSQGHRRSLSEINVFVGARNDNYCSVTKLDAYVKRSWVHTALRSKSASSRCFFLMNSVRKVMKMTVTHTWQLSPLSVRTSSLCFQPSALQWVIECSLTTKQTHADTAASAYSGGMQSHTLEPAWKYVNRLHAYKLRTTADAD